jgi:hypothetical protein
MARTDSGYNNPSDLIQYGPTIEVRIGYDPDYQPSPGRRAQLPPELLPALVDTGAQETALDAELAYSLNLPILERRQIAGAGGFLRQPYIWRRSTSRNWISPSRDRSTAQIWPPAVSRITRSSVAHF